MQHCGITNVASVHQTDKSNMVVFTATLAIFSTLAQQYIRYQRHRIVLHQKFGLQPICHICHLATSRVQLITKQHPTHHM